MSLGSITLTATLNSTSKWVLLTVSCTGMTHASVYRMTPDGAQAVRGALNVAAPGALNVADYEAPQNTTLTYYVSVTDGTTTHESTPVIVSGQVDRGGDCVFGMANPLAPLVVTVSSFPELKRPIRRDVVKVIGREDPVVITDTRQYASGELTVVTHTDAERQTMIDLLADGGVIAFSPQYPTYGFTDIWYLSVGDATERRLTPLGVIADREFVLDVQRVAPPPADFVGPAFRTWQSLKDAGVTWNSLFTGSKTWLQTQVL